jgi:hypothetical protein
MFQLFLNSVPLVRNIIEILDYAILDHLGYHVCIVLDDHVLWGCFVCLHLLVRTPHLDD